MSWTILDNRHRVNEYPHLVAPVDPRTVENGQAFSAINNVRGVRAVMPAAGVLMDLHVAVLSASGNAKGGVYDAGQAAAGVRTKLWEGASTPLGGTGYVKLGDPGISVVAGQHVDLAVQLDNTTATILRAIQATQAQLLPFTYAQLDGPQGPEPVAPTVTSRYGWAQTPAGFAMDATLAEGALATSGFLPLIVARIV